MGTYFNCFVACAVFFPIMGRTVRFRCYMIHCCTRRDGKRQREYEHHKSNRHYYFHYDPPFCCFSTYIVPEIVLLIRLGCDKVMYALLLYRAKHVMMHIKIHRKGLGINMSIESVKEHFKQWNRESDVM